MTTKDAFPVGSRVVMFGDHPWAGHAGEVVRYELFTGLDAAGERPIILLDDGSETTVFKPQHIGKFPVSPRRKSK